MNDKYLLAPAAFVILVRDNKVVLSKRKNTGFMDGYYDLPSGHIERGETPSQAAAREAAEEVGITISEDDLELFHVSQSEVGDPYIYFFMRTENWSGEPRRMEPKKSDEVKFFPLNRLPFNTVLHVKKALENINSKKVTFAYLKSEDYVQN